MRLLEMTKEQQTVRIGSLASTLRAIKLDYRRFLDATSRIDYA